MAELLASKDRYLGTRVKVKGMPGPVMVHHKSLMLKGPQGMVEVLFGNLPDPKLVQSLSSTALDKPLTVTGVVNLPPAREPGPSSRSALRPWNSEAGPATGLTGRARYRKSLLARAWRFSVT